MIKIRPSDANNAARVLMKHAVTDYVTKQAITVTDGVTHCPTCGHKLKRHPSAAAKQKAYRERRKHV